MDMKIKWKKSDDAVSEVIGAILMVGIGVALFAILYFIVMSYPFTPSSPSVDIVGTIEGNNIILEHRGGDSLDLDTTVSLIVGVTRNITTVDAYLKDSNGNNRWDIGEQLVVPYGIMTNLRVEAIVVDIDSNSIVMMGILQEGEAIMTPYVTTLDATDITGNSAKLWMNYNFIGESGSVRFTYKPSGGNWINTTWVSKSGSGSYSETINSLSAGKVYYFKAQLTYNSTEIEGVQKSFTTQDTTIGIWHFDEGSGNIAYDSSGNNNNGTRYGASWVAGVNSTALSYDGENDYVNVPHADSLNLTDEITIEAWMKPLGEEFIGGIIEKFEFDTSNGYEPNIIHVSGDVYAIAYRGSQDDGFLKTVNISSSGTINDTVIDTFEFDPSDCYDPNIIHISDNVYAIAYRGTQDDGFLRTITIASNGQITEPVIDTIEFDTQNGGEPNIIYVSGDVYAIAYRGFQDDGFLRTIIIASNGQITDTIIDTLEFDTSTCYEPNIIHILGNIFSIAYRGPDDDGFLKTTEIASNGQITDTIVDTLEFETATCYEPNIIHASGDVYAITYFIGTGFSGNLLTVRIASNGQVTDTIIDELSYEPDRCFEPNIIRVSGDTYAVAYRGTSAHFGFVNTLDIASDGQIKDTITDDFAFDERICYDPDIIHIYNDIYAIAYNGPSPHPGCITTIRIAAEPAFKGIYKRDAYGIYANTTTAFASINGYNISGALSTGWNHVALTYDKNAGSNQLKLYINGSLTTQGTLTDAINTNTNNLLFGDIFNGIIDEIGIYNRAFSPAEILARYNDNN
jgi:hypothetical protein